MVAMLHAIPQKGLKIDEVVLVQKLLLLHSILDTYIPSMGVTARSGAGFGIGANLVGFPGNVPSYKLINNSQL